MFLKMQNIKHYRYRYLYLFLWNYAPLMHYWPPLKEEVVVIAFQKQFACNALSFPHKKGEKAKKRGDLLGRGSDAKRDRKQ